MRMKLFFEQIFLITFTPKNHEKNQTQQAILTIAGFETLYLKLERTIAIECKSQSMLSSYARSLAQMALHFNQLPTTLNSEQIDQYLYEAKLRNKSETAFKFIVYSLRFAYKIEGIEHLVKLPRFKKVRKLPVVLSKNEVRNLLAAPRLQKHRMLLSLLYGCGLRCMEARNLRIDDLDFERQMLHVKQGKGGKDRYIPLNISLIAALKVYLAKHKPKEWLFNGKPLARDTSSNKWRYSQRGAQWVVTQAARKAAIGKRVSTHTLRHSFATHLLEDGLDIVTIKELLGHSKIETTLVYLHVVQMDRRRAFSPLDTLYGQPIAGTLKNSEQGFVCPALALFKNHKADVLPYTESELQ